MGLLDQLGGALGGQGEEGLGAVLGALGDDNGGGLGGLLGKAQAMGLGETVQSWVGKGDNLPISPEQIQGILGSGVIGDFAQKMGIDPKQAAGQLSALLPQVIDQLTPDGRAPEGALGGGLGGGLGDLLGGLLRR